MLRKDKILKAELLKVGDIIENYQRYYILLKKDGKKYPFHISWLDLNSGRLINSTYSQEDLFDCFLIKG